MLAQIEFDYSINSELEKLGPAIYEEFRERFKELELGEWSEGAAKPPYIYGRRTIIDLTTDGVWLTEHGLSFSLKRFKGAYYTDANIMGNRWAYGKPNPDAPPPVHIQVAIPDLALLSLNEVCVLEDACTDELQGKLDGGWRIIAVCPPNSQRRPDYVLGRRSP